MKTTFDLQTKIGLVYLTVQGEHIMVSTGKNESYKETNSFVTIRGKDFRGHMHFVRVGSKWDGLTWSANGNSNEPVGSDESTWRKIRQVYLNVAGGDTATDAAKLKFYDEMKAAVNEFYRQNRKEIDGLINVLAVNRAQEKVEGIESEITALNEKLAEKGKELEAAKSALTMTKWAEEEFRNSLKALE